MTLGYQGYYLCAPGSAAVVEDDGGRIVVRRRARYTEFRGGPRASATIHIPISTILLGGDWNAGRHSVRISPGIAGPRRGDGTWRFFQARLLIDSLHVRTSASDRVVMTRLALSSDAATLFELQDRWTLGEHGISPEERPLLQGPLTASMDVTFAPLSLSGSGESWIRVFSATVGLTEDLEFYREGAV